MNRIILSAIALTVATPVLADQSQIVQSFNQRIAETESGNQPQYIPRDYTLTREAAAIHVRLSNEADGGNNEVTVEQLLDGPGTIVNERAAMILKQLADEADG